MYWPCKNEAVAKHAPLVDPDFAAAVNYIKTGRPFMIFVDASEKVSARLSAAGEVLEASVTGALALR